MREHCWHQQGRSWTGEHGGGAQYVCCFCGQQWLRHFREEQKLILYHGPHYRQPVMIWEEFRESDHCLPKSA